MQTKPVPIRIPDELQNEIKEACDFTGLPAQDVMRLAMRIGLVDLRASKHIANIIQEVATDKGQSFLAWAREQAEADEQTPSNQKVSEPATAAASPLTTRSGLRPSKPTAKIARLPRPTIDESAEIKVAETPQDYTFTDRRKTR